MSEKAARKDGAGGLNRRQLWVGEGWGHGGHPWQGKEIVGRRVQHGFDVIFVFGETLGRNIKGVMMGWKHGRPASTISCRVGATQ